jgi:hypothetical protein
VKGMDDGAAYRLVLPEKKNLFQILVFKLSPCCSNEK